MQLSLSSATLMRRPIPAKAETLTLLPPEKRHHCRHCRANELGVPMANIAVVFAGGVGARMAHSSRPKQFLEIHGRPVIVHTLDVFQQHPDIDSIAVAILPEFRDYLERLVKRYELTKVQWVVDGGSTGQESRHNALKVVAENNGPDSLVLVHDGVRPLIDADLVSRNIETALEFGSAVTSTKMTETV